MAEAFPRWIVHDENPGHFRHDDSIGEGLWAVKPGCAHVASFWSDELAFHTKMFCLLYLNVRTDVEEVRENQDVGEDQDVGGNQDARNRIVRRASWTGDD